MMKLVYCSKAHSNTRHGDKRLEKSDKEIKHKTDLRHGGQATH